MARLKNGEEVSSLRSNPEGMTKVPFAMGVLLCAVLIVLSVFGALFFHYFAGGDIPWLALSNYGSAQYWGQLGDFAGGFLNPILSFLALMAVLKTMALQRSEMRAAQDEAKAANLEQKIQSNLYTKQAFEATFFGMLEVHSRILNDIQDSDDQSCRGRDAINQMLAGLRGTYTYKGGSLFPEMVDEACIQERINVFCTLHRGQVGHYFRNLYWILKKIDGSRLVLEFEEQAKTGRFRQRRFFFEYLRKREYASLVRAQLSEGELALLQLNCLGPYGAGLKHYVEKYSLLKPLEPSFFGAWGGYINGKFHRLAIKSGNEISLEELNAFMASENTFKHLRAKAKAANS